MKTPTKYESLKFIKAILESKMKKKQISHDEYMDRFGKEIDRLNKEIETIKG